MNVLFTTYYKEFNRQRKSELDFCLELNESSFDEVIAIAENVEHPPYPEFSGLWASTSERPMYSDVFELTHCYKKSDIIIISNCDIVLPKAALKLIQKNLKPDQVYCLTRWEVDKSGSYLRDVFYSQDVWCFRGPVKKKVFGEFFFGVPGCDNRLSCELMSAGYEVQNPSKSIRTYHLHSSQVRTRTNGERNRVPPPYVYITPHALKESPKLQRADSMEQRRQISLAKKRIKR